jgi:hypothetical protein
VLVGSDDSRAGSLDQEDELFFFDTDDPAHRVIFEQEQTPPSPDLSSGGVKSKKSPWDFEKLRPRFGWAPFSVIKNTLEKSTQYYRELYNRIPMRDHFKTRFPAANVHRRHEPVAMDWVYSDAPAIDSVLWVPKSSLGLRLLLQMHMVPKQMDSLFSTWKIRSVTGEPWISSFLTRDKAKSLRKLWICCGHIALVIGKANLIIKIRILLSVAMATSRLSPTTL